MEYSSYDCLNVMTVTEYELGTDDSQIGVTSYQITQKLAKRVYSIWLERTSLDDSSSAQLELVV